MGLVNEIGLYNKSNQFHLDKFLEENERTLQQNISITESHKFYDICKYIKENFQKEFEKEKSHEEQIEIQRRAILGHEKEVKYYKDKIEQYLSANKFTHIKCPKWYKDINDAIFQENWGMAGLSEWLEPKTEILKSSSSAKIVGDRVFFMENGKMVLKPQKISEYRRNQLRKGILLDYPNERLSDGVHEIYLTNGMRVTMISGDYSKKGQDIFVFRRYVLQEYTFEAQAKRRTIPIDIVPLLKNMVKLGYNISFNGPVRTGKTTFLTTWQSYSNKNAEGVLIETDPEISLHEIMGESPITQLIADGEDLENIMKPVLRLDGDYIVMAEARDGTAFRIMLDSCSRGNRNSKMTSHFTHPNDFPYLVAEKIIDKYGGDIGLKTLEVAKNINYVFNFIQLSDKSQKRLEGIYEFIIDEKGQILVHKMCEYDLLKDNWSFSYYQDETKQKIGLVENKEAYEKFDEMLKKLSKIYPMKSNSTFRPPYNKLL